MGDLNSDFNLDNVTGECVNHISFTEDQSLALRGMHGIDPVPASVVRLNVEELTDLQEDDLQELMPLRPEAPPVTGKPKVLKSKGKGKTGGCGSLPSAQRKRYQCTVESCQYSTPYAKDLARHMRKHTGEKPYQCPKCTKAFSRYDKLKIHAMTHEGIRPHKCNFCTYASSDSGSLRKHVRTHTNERPYKCQLCPYQARDSSQLVIHLRHHTGDTPYVCMHEGCKAAFKTPSDLQRHNRLHTGEKPYACPYCSYRAAVKCNLSVHVKKVHNRQQTAMDQPMTAPNPPFAPMASEDVNLTPCPGYTPDNMDVISGHSSSSATTLLESLAQSNASSISTSCKTDPLVKHQRKTSRSRGNRLPFQYACKSCPVRCDTLKAFKNHVVQTHKGVNLGQIAKSLQDEAKSVIVSPMQSKSKVVKTDVAKVFECNQCSASFAVEESLKCHLKQHASKIVSPPCVPPHVDLGNQHLSAHYSRYGQPDGSFPSDARTPDLPVIVRSETAVIAGQKQQVYVIVRNSNVPEKQTSKLPDL